ncbi:MAG: IMP dehydrogenase, partial [Arenicellales bacterium]|nr:IMP dehydrogenase [Arenicellales bacterium]
MNKQSLDPLWIGKTFDDFLFRPQMGVTASRAAVPLSSSLTHAIALELPIISSNMYSVTGGDMAQTMALEGGLGVVHRGQSIERQSDTVARVKRSHSAVIEHPRTLPAGSTIGEARAFARKYKINGILIENSPGSTILAGVLTRRDIPWDRSQDSEIVDRFMTPLAQLKTAGPQVATEEA